MAKDNQVSRVSKITVAGYVLSFLEVFGLLACAALGWWLAAGVILFVIAATIAAGSPRG